MKKVLVLLLLMVSTSVFAEWTRVTDSKDGDMTVYIDYETIKRKVNKVKIWILFDFKTVKKAISYRYLSQMERDEYDCDEETSRMLDLYWYSGNMKQGDIVYRETNMKDGTLSLPPGSTGERLLKIACGKK